MFYVVEFVVTEGDIVRVNTHPLVKLRVAYTNKYPNTSGWSLGGNNYVFHNMCTSCLQSRVDWIRVTKPFELDRAYTDEPTLKLADSNDGDCVHEAVKDADMFPKWFRYDNCDPERIERTFERQRQMQDAAKATAQSLGSLKLILDS